MSLTALANGTVTRAATGAAAAQATNATAPALSWNTLLAFGAVLLAAMQGTLVLESSDPCRISYKKYVMLLCMEAAELVIVVASEVVSFAELRTALRVRLQWLQWIAPCLLVIGLLEVLSDLWFTLQVATNSRLYWIPFSYIGKRDDEGRSTRSKLLLELIPMIVTATMSLVLVGWRQGWWLVAPRVEAEVAEAAVKGAMALSVGALGFCVGWGIVLTVLLVAYLVVKEVTFTKGGYSMVLEVIRAFKPAGFYRQHSNVHVFKEPDEEQKKMWRDLYQFKFTKKVPEDVEDKDVVRCLRTAPLHLRNSIFTIEKQCIYEFDESSNRRYHLLVLFVEHFTVLPLQICIVIGLVQTYKSLDQPTFAALKELVDAIIVVALVEIAVGLKAFIWGASHSDELHDNDKALLDP